MSLNDVFRKPDANKDMAGDSAGSSSRMDQASLQPLPTVQAPAIGLPTGGGAIRGIDEKFMVNAVNGTASCSIPIPVSQARGFGPAMVIAYNSGAGNGVFGLGWSLSQPSIKRRTDKQLPLYGDATDSDVYLLSGAEDLVPVFRQLSDGTYVRDETGQYVAEEIMSAGDSHRIRRYRPRSEGAFARIERWTEMATGFIHWQVLSADNHVSVYGQSSAARIADPSDPVRIFEWLLQYTFDDKGNVMVFEYKREDGQGMPLSLHNRNRRNGNSIYINAYLKNVWYGNKAPYAGLTEAGGATVAPTPPTASRDVFLFVNTFDYGEHDPVQIPFSETGPWAFRGDAFSSYKAGFEVRTCRLCRRVLLYHYFEELPGGSALTQSLDLTYGDNGTSWSFLLEAAITGYTKHDDGSYTQRTHPPLSFQYQGLNWDTTVREVPEDSILYAPAGLAASNYQFTDLYGEGLSGMLTEQAHAWWYAGNEGSGHFAAARLIGEKPSFDGIDRQLQFTDLAGDGRRQLTSKQQMPRGYFELEEAPGARWQPFVAFQSLPSVNFQDANLRLLDLDGDGAADILLTEQEILTWYPSLGREGYGPSRQVHVSSDEEKGPAQVFSDPTHSIFLADMTGDGLVDIVRIRNGEVCYWPNLGYGRFGAKVTMDGSPVPDNEDLFDQTRIRMADIDGSGTADIIYMGRNGISIWLNNQGNSFTPAPTVPDMTAYINAATRIDVLDLLGTGLSCLTWSSPLPEDARAPLRYMDLMASVKPYLINAYVNNMGLETELTYTPSTYFYLEDRRNGTPWVTRLHFPVWCLSKVVLHDRIARTTFTSEYSYHHGYYDHIEKEFRGFGRVDRQDAEDIDHFVARDGNNTAIGQDLHQPPVLTRTWYHSGAFLQGKNIMDHFVHEYVQVAGQNILSEPLLPAGLTTDEYREALRACKGVMLRKEVYALDGGPLQHVPYVVDQVNSRIQLLQPRGGNRNAVFMVHECEHITYTYERDLTDPRIAHSCILELDAYGNVLGAVSLVYGRRPRPDAEPEQLAGHILYTEHQCTNAVVSASAYRIPQPFETTSYEVTGLTPPSGGYFDVAGLGVACANAALIDFEVVPGAGVQKRVIGKSRIQYRADDTVTPLAFGSQSARGLLHQTFRAVSNQAMLSVFESKLPASDLGTKLTDPVGGAYVFSDGYYWQVSGICDYDAAHFYLSTHFTDAFGHTTAAVYDPKYTLFIQSVTDALGNTVSVERFNYRIVGPSMTKDINGNVSAVRYDELGSVVRSFRIGKAGIDQGDEYDLTKVEIRGAVDFPGVEMEYSLTEWYDQSKPNFVRTVSRETHYHADGGNAPKLQISLAYFNGGGGTILTKKQAAPGAALQVQPDGTVVSIPDTSPNLRWVGSGRTILNNKGNAVKKYEPYFSVNEGFDDEKEMVELGVTPILHYDPLDRLVRADLPDGTFTKVVFTPWEHATYDNNDTVLDSDWYVRRGRPDPTTAEPSDPAVRSAWLTAKHAGTPSVARLDALGRIFLTIADNVTEKLSSRIRYAITGQQLTIRDAMDRLLVEYAYDMAGTRWTSSGLDDGHRWIIHDVAGKVLLQWDDRDHLFTYAYDALGRITAGLVATGAGAAIVHSTVEYGDLQAGAADNNLKGKPWKNSDQSGLSVNLRCDFKGNILQTSRQLASNFQQAPDWSQNVVLEQEVFQTATAYDALNRAIRLDSPHVDGQPYNQIIPQYEEGGLFNKVQVVLRDTGSGPVTMDLVTGVQYDAKGQRQVIRYGNNSMTRYTYEKDTFRLQRLLTTRNNGADVLQDLQYIYDPTGNVTWLGDASQSDVFFDGEKASALQTYAYDALYRLITATGRKHAGQTDIRGAAQTPDPGAQSYFPFMNSGSVSPTDTNAFRNYTENYHYDKAGNITSQQHVAKNSSWTRTFEYAQATNANNHLTGTAIGSDTYHYTYDPHGNMLGLETMLSAVWDFQDHFVQADLGGGGKVYHVYDNAGQRCRKVVVRQDGSRYERISLGGWELYRSRSSAGEVLLERESLHVMNGARRLVLIDTPLVMPVGNTETRVIRYQYTDHLDSASLELDETGRVLTYETYFPWGATSYSMSDSTREVSSKRFRYTGKERDEETGLNYHGARYYVLWLCRWTAADPAGVDASPNLYVYVHNNPVRSIDPGGTDDIDTICGSTGPTLCRAQIEDALKKTGKLNVKKDDGQPPPDVPFYKREAYQLMHEIEKLGGQSYNIDQVSVSFLYGELNRLRKNQAPPATTQEVRPYTAEQKRKDDLHMQRMKIDAEYIEKQRTIPLYGLLAWNLPNMSDEDAIRQDAAASLVGNLASGVAAVGNARANNQAISNSPENSPGKPVPAEIRGKDAAKPATPAVNNSTPPPATPPPVGPPSTPPPPLPRMSPRAIMQMQMFDINADLEILVQQSGVPRSSIPMLPLLKGRAAESFLADSLAKNPSTSGMVIHLGGANQPDFIPNTPAGTNYDFVNNPNFDVFPLNDRAREDHLGRFYGPTMIPIYYLNPPKN